MPNRYGHVPGHLRDALIDALEVTQDPPSAGETVSTCFFYDAAQQDRWDAMTAEDRVRWLTGQLWNCTDVVPCDVCSDYELPQGSTYAQLVRKLRAEL